MSDAEWSWADNVHFGPVGKRMEFTQEELAAAEFDPDDEPLAESDPGLVAILGFDPLTANYDLDEDPPGA